MTKKYSISDLYKKKINDNKEIIINGWIKTNRHNSKIGFISLNDGTTIKNAQLVYRSNYVFFEQLTKLLMGSSLEIIGVFKNTPKNQQPFEIDIKKIISFYECNSDYPLQKQKHNFEFLREIAYIRGRTNTFIAVDRVRNGLSMAMHEFLQKKKFVWIHNPIITTNDAEGAGKNFKVVVNDENFFNHDAFLTVSGQLHAEALALSLGNVYTFSTTFRAEKSHTAIHASEFWMLEPEMAFADLEDVMKMIESLLKFCIRFILRKYEDEMNFFNKFIDNDLLKKLNSILKSNFSRVTYTEVIKILKEKSHEANFENNNIFWGMDLKTEHERFVAEHIFKGPVFITDYPEEIKAFYMRLNNDGETVASCDLLMPEVGELAGGSQREERYTFLRKKLEKLTKHENLEWYLNLRKYGCCKHSGFGIGFDRLLMYITGMKNIRDVQVFPRIYGSIKY